MTIDEDVLRILNSERLRLARIEIERAALALQHACDHLDEIQNVADLVVEEIHCGIFNGAPFPSALRDAARGLSGIAENIQAAEHRV